MSKLHAFVSNPLCGLSLWAHCLANVEDDSRNVTKHLGKTVILIHSIYTMSLLPFLFSVYTSVVPLNIFSFALLGRRDTGEKSQSVTVKYIVCLHILPVTRYCLSASHLTKGSCGRPSESLTRMCRELTETWAITSEWLWDVRHVSAHRVWDPVVDPWHEVYDKDLWTFCS